MKKNFVLYLCFVMCFVIGFVCGMYVKSYSKTNRIESGADAIITDNVSAIKCLDGKLPDSHGCCTGEEYTYIIDTDVWACCPEGDGDCFPPIPLGSPS